MAGSIHASLAIRPCFVDTLPAFKAPPCFSGAILVQRRLAFLDRLHPSSVRRRHQDYQSAKTSCAEHEVAMDSHLRSSPCLMVRSRAPETSAPADYRVLPSSS